MQEFAPGHIGSERENSYSIEGSQAHSTSPFVVFSSDTLS